MKQNIIKKGIWLAIGSLLLIVLTIYLATIGSWYLLLPLFTVISLVSLYTACVHKVPTHHFAVVEDTLGGHTENVLYKEGLCWLWPWKRFYAIISMERVQIESAQLKVDNQRFTTSNTESFLVNPGSATIGVDFDYPNVDFVKHLCHFLHGDDDKVITDASGVYKSVDEFFRQALKKAIGARTGAEILALKKTPVGVSEGLFPDIKKEMEHLFHKNHMPLQLISAVFDLDQPASVEVGMEKIRAQEIEAAAKNAFIAKHIIAEGGRALLALYAAHTADIEAEEEDAKANKRLVDKALLEKCQKEIEIIVGKMKPFKDSAEKAWREKEGFVKETKTTYDVPPELLVAAKEIFGKK